MSRLANAITDVLEGLCDQVIEKGRSIFATLAGLDPSDIGFDRRSGRFFVLERSPSGTVLELAGAARRGYSMSVEMAGWLREAPYENARKGIEQAGGAGSACRKGPVAHLSSGRA
jgi:hypothetical protein